MFRFESPGVGVRSSQRDETGDKDLIQPVRMSLRIDGRTEGFGVTMQAFCRYRCRKVRLLSGVVLGV